MRWDDEAKLEALRDLDILHLAMNRDNDPFDRAAGDRLEKRLYEAWAIVEALMPLLHFCGGDMTSVRRIVYALAFFLDLAVEGMAAEEGGPTHDAGA
jgi:hypothetical protein